MTISMYQASVPVFQQMLGGLAAILDKAGTYAAQRRIDPVVLVQGRLYPDMFPLSRQVQSASDNAKGASARLAGIEVPRFEDTETTIDELKVRLVKTLDFIGGIPASAIDGSEDREVRLGTGARERIFKGEGYLLTHALPNFFFHVATAYNILRHNGLEIGKKDFMGA